MKGSAKSGNFTGRSALQGVNTKNSGGLSKVVPGINKAYRFFRERVWTFFTNKSGVFTPAITKTAGPAVTWDFGDGQGAVSNTPSITYTNSNIKRVQMFCADSFRNINQITILNSLNIVGTLDLRQFIRCITFQIYGNPGVTNILPPSPEKGVVVSGFSASGMTGIEDLDLSAMTGWTFLSLANCSSLQNLNLPYTASFQTFELTLSKLRTLNATMATHNGGVFTVTNNLLLTKIENAPTSALMSAYQVNSNDLTGALDLSIFTGGMNNLYCHTNPKLTSITPTPAVTNNMTFIDFYSCNITGVIDLSNFRGNIAIIRGYSNPLLTGVIFYNGSKNYDYILISSCNLTGNLDCTGMLLGGYFDVGNNPNLTSVSHSPSARSFNTGYYLYSCNITGTHDMSMLTKLGSDIRLGSNPNCTQWIFPVSNEPVTQMLCGVTGHVGVLDISGMTVINTGANIQFNNSPALTNILFAPSANLWAGLSIFTCNLTGILDLSMLTGGWGQLLLYSNPLLTGVTMPVSAGVFSYFDIHTTGITTLNLSTLTGMNGEIRAWDCASLTSITFPITTGKFYTISCFSNNLTGTADLSTLLFSTATGAAIQFQSNPLLTAIIIPTQNTPVQTFLAFSCNISTVNFLANTDFTDINGCRIELYNNTMTAAEVNKILVDLDTISVGGFTGRIILLHGTNAAPDAVSGGNNGTAAKASLIVKGFTVTTN